MIQEKLKELELQLNYVCYDKELITRLSKVWDAYYDLKSEVKKLNLPPVSNSLPVDYLQKEMIKAIKELAKESTAPDKDTPDWMENDIKRGMQWMHKKLTGNDC